MIRPTPEPPGSPGVNGAASPGPMTHEPQQPSPPAPAADGGELAGGVVSVCGEWSYIAKSSSAPEPGPFSPIPIERLVTPAGTTGVDQLACVQVDDEG